MSSIVVVRGGGDPTADLLSVAARRLGQHVQDIDLRIDRLTIDVTSDGATVRAGQRTLEPSLVFNRTEINGLGLSSGDGLKRQIATHWRDRHTQGREEQGLLLAVFEAWERTDVTLVNRTRAADMSLMPNSVVDRLVRMGEAVHRGKPTSPQTEVLICAGVPIAHRGATADRRHQALARRVADAAEFSLGAVRMSTGANVVVRGWTHRPLLEQWDNPEAVAVAIVAATANLDPDALHDVPPRYFVDDLGRN